jgi:predicted N-acetyltransferase YhbS
MSTIRTARVAEFGRLMRFMEVCFGHSRNCFPREMPHLYAPTRDALRCAHVVEDAGRIVAHVGLYPLTARADGAVLRIGGIGGVSTLASERKKGHMTALLDRVIRLMREGGFALSALGGDRQRYGPFGWDHAGVAVRLTFTRRSLERGNLEALAPEERTLDEALATVRRLHVRRACYVARPRLSDQLRKPGLRFWTAPDSYAITRGENSGEVQVCEMFSGVSAEPAFVLAILRATTCGSAVWTVSAHERPMLWRLLPHASGLSTVPDWSYRIVDLFRFLSAERDVIARRAVDLGDFEATIGIVESDRTDTATIRWRHGRLDLSPGGNSRRCVEMGTSAALHLLLGGPSHEEHERVPPGLRMVLPLPVHIPVLDHL